jgi:energy-coupling factor transporter ATP-binding protein EcfA2
MKEYNTGRDEEEVIRFHKVGFGYDHGEGSDFRLSDLSFTLTRPGIYGLIGSNGVGKSTIAHLMLRLEQPGSGEIALQGKPLAELRRGVLMESICYISQFPEQQITLSNVEQYRHRAKRNQNRLSLQLLNECFDPSREYPLAQLSPLELKMLTLSSTISTKTGLIILDEPTWGLDDVGLVGLFSILTKAIRALKGVALLIITHETEIVELLDANVLYLREGHLLASTTRAGSQNGDKV